MTEEYGNSPKKNESTSLSAGYNMQDTSSRITPEPLDGTNYVEWALNAQNKIRGRKRWGFISGVKAAPKDVKSEEYETWEDENCMVKSWLLDAMTKDIRSLFLRLSTAKEIWDAVKQTYSVSQDASKAYQLHCEVIYVHQNGGSVISFFGKLQKLWQEFDTIDPCNMECTRDIERYTTLVNSQRLYIFLAGLDSHLDGVRGRILATTPLPNLQAAYAIVCTEANRQDAMLNVTPSDGAVMAARRSFFHDSKKGVRKCTHCNGDNHVIDTCFKLHGYPEWHPKGKTSSPVSSYSKAGGSISKSNLVTTSGFIAKSGISNSAQSLPLVTGNSAWIIDSGATDNMTCDRQMFSNLSSSCSKSVITNANGVSSPIVGIGTVSLSPSLSLTDTLFIPSLNCNLMSVSQLTKSHNCVAIFFPTHCIFQNIHTKELIGSGKEKGGLYYLDGRLQQSIDGKLVHAMSNTILKNKEEIWLWHKRLGHPSFGYLSRLFPSLFKGCHLSDFVCETCIMAKSHRTVFHSHDNKTTTPFALVHSDVWGPAPLSTHNEMKWFITFIDDCTRMTWIYLMRKKSDVFAVFCAFHKMVLTQFGISIKVLRSDNGGEYVKRELTEFMTSVGTLHQTSCTNTPQQNGIAERKNRHLLEVTRSLLLGGHVPSHLWGEALSSAVYLINRTPSSVVHFRRPLDVLSDQCTLFSVVQLIPRIFGCVVYVHLHTHQRTKLDPRALKCVFVGYGSSQKGYKCYHPPTHKFYITMDVTFHEHTLYYSVTDSLLQRETTKEVQNHDDLEIVEMFKIPDILATDCKSSTPTKENRVDSIDYEDPVPDSTLSPTTEPLIQSSPDDSLEVSPDHIIVDNLDLVDTTVFHSEPSQYHLPPRSNRGKPPSKYDPDRKAKVKYSINNHVSSHRLSKSYASYVHQLSSVSIPSKLQEALLDSRWTKSMAEEMAALEKNATWELVPLPKGKKTVGCRWVFTIKHKADGSIERYKARLVAKGYTQSYGEDYQETFAPVAKLNTVRVLLSLAANQNWPLLQFDVKNAFLHGDLVEEVYMDPPPGILEYSKTKMVCKLKKALYGLKQSPRAWFGRFTKSMRSFGYKQSNSDHTLFLKRKKGKITALIIYVDDMVVTGDDHEEISKLQKYLSSEFEMKQLGDLKYFLGIEVARSKHGIFLSQRKYVLDLLSETRMLGCKPVKNPIEQNHKLFECSSASRTDKGRYQRLVGKLIYLSHTRPDIAYAVSVVSQFMHDPRKPHMDAVDRILKYLKYAPGKGLLFSKHDHLKVEGYTDADWAGSADDRKSTSGYFTFVGGNLVTWRSKKQPVVARSSAEAEYRGMALGVCELLWLRNLLTDLGFKPKREMNLHCDNQSAIAIAHNPVQHDRTKHVEIDRHFIKEKLEAGIISFPFVKSEDQLADVLTKAVASTVLFDSLIKLGMCDIYAPT